MNPGEIVVHEVERDRGGMFSSFLETLNRAKQRRFWGCVAYPTCTGTRDTDGRSAAERQSENNE